MSESPAERWRRCSTCKRDIGFDRPYWACSVSTCNRVRGALQFCSVSCWDAHVPILRHRDAWAVEERSPKTADADGEHAAPVATAAPRAAPRAAPPAASPPRPAPVAAQPAAPRPAPAAAGGDDEQDILIVVSKLKKYIRDRSGFNTSDGCAEILSDHVRVLCERAIASARANERRTVLARDIPEPP